MFVGINYLVQVDNEGKLRWTRNGELVDTTAGHWKDAGGRGIVPLDEPEVPVLQERASFSEREVLSRNSDSLASGGINTTAAKHYYTGKHVSSNPVKRWFWKNFTLRGLLDRLLRKTINRNTWIYVSVRDEQFDLLSLGLPLGGFRTKTVGPANAEC